MMFLLANWRLMAVGLLCVALGVQTLRLSNANERYAELNAAIALSAAESERAVRVALANAAERERIERERLLVASDAAAARARADADAARRKASDLSRRIQELSDADPSVDAWRVTPVPLPIRGLLATDNHQT